MNITYLQTGCVKDDIWIPAKELHRDKHWRGRDSDTFYINILEPKDLWKIQGAFENFDCDNINCDCDNFQVQMQTLNGWEPLEKFNFSVRITTKYEDRSFYIQVLIRIRYRYTSGIG